MKLHLLRLIYIYMFYKNTYNKNTYNILINVFFYLEIYIYINTMIEFQLFKV